MNRVLITTGIVISAMLTFGQEPGYFERKKTTDVTALDKVLNSLVTEGAKKADEDDLDSIVLYTWESQNSAWAKQATIKVTYDSKDHPTLFEYYAQGLSPYLESAIEVEFDDEGRLLSKKIKSTDGVSEQWYYEDNEEYTYDEDGNEIEYIYQEHDGFKFVNELRRTTTYNEDNKPIKQVVNRWGVQWNKHRETVLSYNGKGQLEETVLWFWDGIDFTMRAGSKETFEYDGEGNLIRHMRLYKTDEDWKEANLTEYTLDKDGNTITKTISEKLGSNWVELSKETFEHDPLGNPTSEVLENMKAGQWEEDSKTEFTYNTSESIEPFLIRLQLIDPSQSHKVVSRFLEQVDLAPDGSGGWENKTRETFHYTSDLSGIDPQHQTGLQIYPNPAHGVVRVELRDDAQAQAYVIRSISGALISKGELDGHNAIDISSIQTGIYVVEVNSGDLVYRSKLLVE